MSSSQWARSIWLVVALAGAYGCGYRGTPDPGHTEPAPAPALPSPADALSLRTSTGINVLPYRLNGLSACSTPSVLPPLAAVSSAFKLDGDLGDWGPGPGLFTDPTGDAPLPVDLVAASAARQGDDLILAATWPVGTPVALELELGGLVASDKVLQAQVRLRLRIHQGQLWELRDEVWRVVEPAQGRLSIGPTGAEVWLSRRLLGDVVTWPAWWLRLASLDPVSRAPADRMAAVYLPSLLAADYAPFRFTACDLWPGQARPFTFHWLQDIPEPTEGADPEQFNQVARYALDAAASLLGRDAIWPVSGMTVVTTINTVNAAAAPAGPSAASDEAAASYRALIVNVGYLQPASDVNFPQGEAFVTVAAAVLGMYLQHTFPEAPQSLVAAVRQGLLDTLIRQHLGPAYWFDHYHASIAPLLAEPGLQDLPRPAVLTVAAAPRAVGHLLSTAIPAPALLSAWALAGSRRPARDVAVAAFVRALHESAPTDASRAAVELMTPGWLDTRAFTPTSGPASLQDSDADGLADYIEDAEGTDRLRSDADGDGWSDLAEVIFGTDANASGAGPGVVVADGLFGDWQTLLPKRLGVDRGRAGACPVAADIHFYAAVVNAKELVLAGAAADFWENEPAAKWEAVVDFPELGRQLLLTATSGAHEFLVIDPAPRHGGVIRRLRRAAPLARKSLELGLSLDDLGIRIPLEHPDAIKIRLRTVFNNGQEDTVCDETDWFTANRSY